jgi:hypothetical protein
MKTLLLLLLVFVAFNLSAQSIDGSWKLTHRNGKAVSDIESVKIYQDGYFAIGTKEKNTNHFLGTIGGLYSLDGKTSYSETFDFNTFSPEKVGKKSQYTIKISGKQLVISGTENGVNTTERWEKVSDRNDALVGTWVITGRKRGNDIIPMTPGARRTVKILAGGRFQWIAFNSDTKEFSGTGGGTYSAENGKYTENIEFFSRDDKRVGASLDFNFEVKDKSWHHSGTSSSGDPIYEVWSSYRKAYLEKQPK